MSDGSDDAYASFLEKANQDPAAGTSLAKAADASKSTTTSKPTLRHDQLVASSRDVPSALSQVQEWYSSETDDAFRPFALPYVPRDSNGPSVAVDDLARVAGYATNQVQEIELDEKRVEDMGSTVVDAVRKVVEDGRVKCFCVEDHSRRFIYFLVGVEKASGNQEMHGGKERRLVGMTVLAVFT